ncbi:protein FAM219B isoform X6 [Equus asinus]|uniref:Family with sequence similarity 219 member B n=2 Tax=Equus TaxID=9789 RepID=A0A8C4M8B2_EQUAS|nr:protein FAM219B isoform X7 [Equus caballus]
MATAEPGVHAARASSPAARPGGTPARVAGAAGPPSGRRGSGVPRLGERTPAAVEKRGPYMVTRAPSIQAKLQKHRDLAKAVLRRKGMLGASPKRPDSSGKRSVKFNKGYTALSQSPDENLVSLDSDRPTTSVPSVVPSMGTQTEILLGWPFGHVSRVIVPDRNKGT